MRVLHVVPTYLPAKRYGGPIFATHALCAALAKMGCEVTVFTTNVDGAGESEVPLDIPVDMEGVKVWYFRSPFLRRLYYSPVMSRRLEEKCGGFDLLHLHSVFLWPTWAAARAARRYSIPYIAAPRGMLVQDLISRKSPWLKKVWISLIEQRNLERAAAIHVTSAVEASELEKFGFALPRIYEVPNGVTAEPKGKGTDDFPPELARLFERGRPVLLNLGRISWKKGLDRLIPVMSKLPDALLLIVGNDEEGYSSKLKELANQAGVADRIIFSGPVYGAAKYALYRKATLFVLPSYSENFGNVVLEAMYEGCPVVVTPEVGAAGIVEASGGGMVTSGEPTSLAEVIKHLLADNTLRMDMGRRGIEAMRSSFSWEATAKRMAEVYQEIVTQCKKVECLNKSRH